jgi:crotonobetainyl-CoA:carnitine CoA-transferase CaiB-like acyl-CoA transferase
VWNRSRRSVALDLKSADGKEQFLDLVGTADVLAESFRPGAMAALGLDYDALAPRFPHLVYCSVPAYPSDSRHAGRAGWDALVQARSGQQFEQQAWRPGPAFLASPLPSIATSYLVPTAILAALHARSVTGRGQRVETSLY